MVAGRLLAILALLRRMWIRLVERDPSMAGYEEICIALGMTEQAYFDWISDSFKENGIHLTKRMKKLFRELRNDFPSAALKGYTWGEYEKHQKDGYQQLTLFEEEMPFQ